VRGRPRPLTPRPSLCRFSPVEYDLTITPNLQPPDFRFQGSLGLTAQISAEGHSAVTLHSKELAILSCSATQGQGEPQDAAAVNFNVEESTVTFVFKTALKPGRVVLRVEFIGTHNNQMAGFYRSGYKDAEGKPQVMVSTQFEALDARRCFPCVDEPAAKAVFRATLVVDENLTALSNMPESEVTVSPSARPGLARKKKVSFLPSPKMSTYLLAFCVGEFDFLQARTEHGVLVRVFTPPTKAHLGAFALSVATKSLDLYDDFFATPYPLPKLDMIAIPEFAMGAVRVCCCFCRH
jgi:aminopeptidase N